MPIASPADERSRDNLNAPPPIGNPGRRLSLAELPAGKGGEGLGIEGGNPQVIAQRATGMMVQGALMLGSVIPNARPVLLDIINQIQSLAQGPSPGAGGPPAGPPPGMAPMMGPPPMAGMVG